VGKAIRWARALKPEPRPAETQGEGGVA